MHGSSNPSNRTPRHRAGLALAALAVAVAAVLALTACVGRSAFSTSAPWLTDWREQRDQAVQAHQELVDGLVFERAVVVRIVDGDTIVVDRGAEAGEEKVRFIGVDAPESVAYDDEKNSEEGGLASGHLSELIEPGATVYLCADKRDTDRYGRLLRHVWLEVPADPFDVDELADKMLGGMMVRDGYAISKRYTPDTTWSDLLDQIESDARANDRGVITALPTA